MSLRVCIQLINSDEDVEDLSATLHDLLADDADWNADYWDFDLGNISKFIEKLRTIYEASSAGISFSATWPPAEISQTKAVNFDELSNLFLRNRIGTRTKYIVEKSA